MVRTKTTREYDMDPEYSEERDEGKVNWLPLLLLPVAFGIGWVANEVGNTTETANQQMAYQNETGFTPGVGGGPDAPCVTPGANGYMEQ